MRSFVCVSSVVAGISALALGSAVRADGVQVGGQLEVNYTYNANKTGTGYYFNSRNSEFALNYGELHVYREATEKSPIGFSFRFVDGEVVRGLPLNVAPYNTSTRNLYEAYGRLLTAAGGKTVTVDTGVFAGMMGYEVIPTTDQFVSRSYQYGTQPFYHAGVRASYVLSPKTTVSGHVVNRYNGTDKNGNRDLGIGFQVAQTLSEKASLYLNGMMAPDTFFGPSGASVEKQKTILNAVYTHKLSDSTRVAAEASFINGKDFSRTSYNAQAVTGYVYVGKAALRGEFLSGNRAATGIVLGDGSKKPSLSSITATYELKSAAGARTLVEARFDNANTRAFVNDRGTSKKNQATFSLMQIFSF